MTTAEKAEIDALPRHSLVYGGDLVAARRINYALWDESDTERSALFAGVAPVLQNADIAMLNIEGMITMGGHYNTLRSCSWMFRAHPALTDVLTSAGVDVVAIGSNHTGDYGRAAIIEEVDHLRKAGIEYTGAGVNFNDAARPVYREVDGTVIAIVSAELSVGAIYAATEDQAGVHFIHAAFKNKADDKALVKYFTGVVEEARKNAHVVVFTPHWDAWETPPVVSDAMRSLAGELIRTAGFDAILAHGRHMTQGVEVVDGKPIIYDAGNALVDFTGSNSPEASRGMLWQVEFSQAGVHSIEGIPIKLTRNRTRLAKGRELTKVLERALLLSSEMNTELRIEDDRAKLTLDPGPILRPTVAAKALARPPWSGEIRLAPPDVLHETLPPTATPADVRFESGIRLVGYELLSDSIRAKKCSSQTVVLYWTADQPVEDSYVVHLEARRVTDGKMKKKILRREDHLPGDWMLPTTEWPPGKVIQDKTNIRLVIKGRPKGGVAFLVGLRKLTDTDKAGSGGVLTAPVSIGDMDAVGKLVRLGTSPYKKGVTHPRAVYKKWRETRQIQLSASQPPLGAPPLNWAQ
jgi:poly-gamma-glutamate capsule biosynthesis protein CapA/YwtB (metallophosphatase superfamily)